MMKLTCTLLTGVILLAAGRADELNGDKKPQPGIVPKILKVQTELQTVDPPNLVVTVTGQVPTGGYTKARLVRVAYAMPPEDGIQDYILFAVPPSGFATQVISEVSAADRWKAYEKDAPWLKGIRVHGVGDGAVVKILAKGK